MLNQHHFDETIRPAGLAPVHADDGRPALWGTEVQLPVPWLEVYASSLASSSGVHGPFFTFALSQHGGRPIPAPFLRLIELENLHQLPVPPDEITAGWYRHTYSGGSGERGTVTTCRDGGEARDGSMSSPLLI
jgi:hypothetical protein